MQTRPTPEVTTGARGPISLSDLQKGTAVDLNERIFTAPAKAGEIVYHSHSTRLMVQITSPSSTLDPRTGRYRDVEGKVARFVDGEFRTSDPESIEILDSNPRCGVNKLYWRSSDLQKAVSDAKENEIREFVLRNPEKISKILQDLGGAQFPADAVTPKPVEPTKVPGPAPVATK